MVADLQVPPRQIAAGESALEPEGAQTLPPEGQEDARGATHPRDRSRGRC